MLTAKEIRESFKSFFETKGHQIVPSAPMVVKDDPTLMFTNAGMNQFKDIILGNAAAKYKRVADSQKCLRVSGKHNDLENVGRTARHHTFFEMLGNFAFASYFKREAITLAWGFITEELKLPKERLYVSVFQDDDEAFALWQEIAGFGPDRIIRMGEKDNFWTMGDTGPCGPCSEIYVDQGEDMKCGPDCGIGKCDCDRFLEIWNLVFTQYDQKKPGERELLEHPNIDTGMGLERIAAICQGKRSNFDCDLFQDIIQYAASVAGVEYSFSAPDTNDVDTALRVIADHSRSTAFMIADGILPSNEGRGYVLRRLIRRALRFSTLMGVQDAFLYKTVGKVIEVMGDDYPELREHADFISKVVFEEENRFRVTLDKGLAMLDSELAALAAEGKSVIPGEVAFRLNDTFGFPLDIVSDVAYKRGFTVDEEGFLEHMQAQRERARAAWKGSGEKDLAGRFKGLLEEGVQSEFVGYDSLKADSRIVALMDEDALPVDALNAGDKGYVVTVKTPFYGAGGGQAGDTGFITAPEGKLKVTDTMKPMPTLTVMQVEVTEGVVHADQEVSLEVTEGIRFDTMRNHTCTHLLQAALRKVLGTHVHQAGSSVGPDHLRFDFTHIKAMTPEEISAVEREVNAMILADHPAVAKQMSYDEAVKTGALALFNEKYGDQVRVLFVGSEGQEPCSVEFCGGTHLARTGQAGSFVILSEGGVAAGVRRIEAATGWNAYEVMAKRRAELNELSAMLKVRSSDIASRVDAMQKEIKALRKELEKAQAASCGDVMSNVEEINGVKVLAVKAGAMNVKALREMMDDVRSKLPSGVACLVGEDGGKAQMLLYVSKDLHDRFTAPALIKEVAVAIAGSGGGRPDQAQAGGTNPAGIDEAFKILKEKIQG